MGKRDDRADLEALNRFVVECEELPQLEALLARFNLFRVLQFEYGEIRHSNVLAWILHPEESHGLQAVFLQKFLMRALHESPAPPVLPAEVATWRLARVEVRREWRHIDVLAILTFHDRSQWVLCLENKVRSRQRENQLLDYRRTVENEFPTAARRIFLFLTKNSEAPADPQYQKASYDLVHRALREAMASRDAFIGGEARVLLENYLRLLEEKFMNKSEVARLALKIYQQHRRALEVISAHHPDAIRAMVAAKVMKRLEEASHGLGVQVEKFTDGIIRFTPRAWDVPANQGFQNYQGNDRHVLLELKLFTEETAFNICSGHSPRAWIEKMWPLTEHAPFQGRIKWREGWFCLFRLAHPQLSLADDALTDPTEMADAAFDWLKSVLAQPDVQSALQIIAQSLSPRRSPAPSA